MREDLQDLQDLQDLLNVVEKKREQLNKIALSKELTSEEVLASSCELDRLLNEIIILSKRKQPDINNEIY